MSVMPDLTSELRCALDPLAFAGQRLSFVADPWQARVLRSTAPRMLLNCSRQAGKSTTTAIIGLHRALYHPHSLVLLISPSLRQSRELFGKAQGFLKTLDTQPRLEEDNRLSMELENGSRLVALPGDPGTIRGFSAPSLIIEDEAAYVDDGLYRAIRPMLAVSGGRLILLSTPNGKRGHFFEAWESDEDWERVSVPASDCPRISPEFLAAERQALGETWYRQEYACHFAEMVDAMFRMEDIEKAISEEVKPLFSGPPTDPDIKPLKIGEAA
jgi:hypothetical protein